MSLLLSRLSDTIRRPYQALARAVKGNPPAAEPGAGPGALQRLILSSARDRWNSPALSTYTPARIENILRGAFSGDLTAVWQLYDLMEGTWPMLAKCTGEMRESLPMHDWSLQPRAAKGAKPSPEAIRRRGVVEDILWGMEPDPTEGTNDLEDLLRDMGDAWFKGFSIQELHWEMRDSDYGLVRGIRSAQWIHPRNYGYPSTTTGLDRLMLNASEITRDNPALSARLTAMEAAGEITRSGNWVTFPHDNFLIATARHKAGHAIGGALLRSLAWWWSVSNFAAQWQVDLAQIFGVPQRFAYYSETSTAEQRKMMGEMLEHMGSAGWGLFPAGTVVEFEEAVRSATDNPSQAVMKAADTAAQLIVLGQPLTSTPGDRGSQALGRVQADVLSERKQAMRTWAAGRINRQLIPMIARLNFGDTRELPFVLTGEEDQVDEKSVAETIAIHLKNGMRVGTAWAHEKTGVPEPGPGEAILGAPPAEPPPVVGGDPAGGPEPGTTPPRAMASARASAAAVDDSADGKLAEAVAESVTGIQAKYLAAVRPWLLQLVRAAQDPMTSEEDLLAMVSRARRNLPAELLPRFDTQSLALAMERNMGAAMVNGVLAGWAERKP